MAICQEDAAAGRTCSFANAQVAEVVTVLGLGSVETRVVSKPRLEQPTRKQTKTSEQSSGKLSVQLWGQLQLSTRMESRSLTWGDARCFVVFSIISDVHGPTRYFGCTNPTRRTNAAVPRAWISSLAACYLHLCIQHLCRLLRIAFKLRKHAWKLFSQHFSDVTKIRSSYHHGPVKMEKDCNFGLCKQEY